MSQGDMRDLVLLLVTGACIPQDKEVFDLALNGVSEG
jgi:hypothetical protein